MKWTPDQLEADYELQRTDVEKRTTAQMAVETALSMFADFDSFMDSMARRSDVTMALKPHYASITGKSSS